MRLYQVIRGMRLLLVVQAFLPESSLTSTRSVESRGRGVLAPAERTRISSGGKNVSTHRFGQAGMPAPLKKVRTMKSGVKASLLRRGILFKVSKIPPNNFLILAGNALFADFVGGVLIERGQDIVQLHLGVALD